MTNEAKLSVVVERTITQLTAILKSQNAQFKIIMPTGEEFGDLEVASKKTQTRSSPMYPRGTLLTYLAPFLDTLGVGELTVIPCGTFNQESLRSAATAHAARRWGNGSATSYVNKETNSVELLRLQ